MNSRVWLCAASLAMAQWLSAGQSAPAQSGFLNETRTDQSTVEKPAKPITPELRGDIYMARKMYREAAEAYQEGPKTALLLNKTGIAYHQMLEFGLAEKYYRQAIKANPKYAEAINNLGTIYYARKSYRRSVKEYQKALRMTPNSASVWSNLAMGYFARKDEKRAHEALDKALSLDPNVFETHGTMGVLLQERSVEERAKYHYFLAETYAKAGDIDHALQYIRKALEEGYKERKKIGADPAFAALKDNAEFKELLTTEPRVL